MSCQLDVPYLSSYPLDRLQSHRLQQLKVVYIVDLSKDHSQVRYLRATYNCSFQSEAALSRPICPICSFRFVSFRSSLITQAFLFPSIMSGCGNSDCKCGSNCSCGSSCSCGSKVGVIQDVSGMESFECDNDGCQCGSSCTCASCKC